jgi:hypothetical protein
MAKVKVSDIIVPEIFAPYVIERTKDLSALFQSGLVEQNEQTNALVGGGGTTANMPFFQDLSGNSEVLSDTTPLTVNGLGTSKDVCAINHRGKAWGSNDLAKAKAGDDPMAAIGDLVAAWWARDMQTTLISIMKGAFASTTMAAEHVLNLSIADGNNAAASNLISSSATINALKKLGDALDAISALAMHSDIYYELVKQDQITFEQPSAQGTVIQRYKGRLVLVDDSLPKVAGATSGFVYSTYMFGTGAIAYGEGNPTEAAVETDRDILQGDSYLVNRRSFIMHPLGVKWIGTAAGASPTNAEFATAANWARVYTRKNVKLIELKTNG